MLFALMHAGNLSQKKRLLAKSQQQQNIQMQLNMLDQVVKQEAMSSDAGGMLGDDLAPNEVEDVPAIAAAAAAAAAGWIVPDSLQQPQFLRKQTKVIMITT